jgi:hypothetical protein
MIHFNYIFVDSPTAHIQSSWLHPKDQQGTHYSSSRYWCDLARTLRALMRTEYAGRTFRENINQA